MGFKAISTIVGYTDTNINAKNTGATAIFTNPNTSGLYFPYKIRIYGANIVTVTSPATISIGTNASVYNNILAATALTGLINGSFIDVPLVFPQSTLQVNDQVFVNVTIGANATTYGCRFAVFMDYF